MAAQRRTSPPVRPSLAGVEPSVTVAIPTGAEAFMRRLLRVPVDAPPASIAGAENAFSKSIAISAIRCILTYVLLPLLAPVLDLTGGVGPALGLVVGTVSMVAIVFSMRRFWAADHAWRWRYTVLGGGILVMLAVGAVFDISTLVT